MRELGECVEGMINDAIDGTQYDLCEQRYDQIMGYMRDLLENFDGLTPENADTMILNINEHLSQIKTLTGE